MKYLIISFFIFFLSFTTIGQVQFHSLSSNPLLFNNSKNRSLNIIDTLKLPFKEDFAYKSIRPDSSLWLDQDVFINNNFANNPPSVGVATFDVLDKNGLLYDTADVSVFVADYLTSKPINLSSYTAADSIYFSFYYQPQGNSLDRPNEKDSLVLQFQTSTKEWHSIYSIPGDSLREFKQVMIPITDTSYFKKDFQFRFFNYATIGGNQNQEDAINTDYWNLDYIVIDTARTINNPYHDDVAFYDNNNSLFYDYYSVPWKHYKLSSMTLDSVDYKLRNLYNSSKPYNHLTYLLYQNNTTAIDSFDNGGGNISEENTKEHFFSQENMGGSNYNNIPTQLTDSTSFKIVRYFNPNDTLFTQNNRVEYTQDFFNYYAYDDGTIEAGISIIGYEAKYAFKITALKEDTLRGLSMLFNRYKDYGTSEPSIFSLCVWEDDNGIPGELIYKEDNINPKYTTGINAFSTYKFKEAVYVHSSFFVGWQNDTRKVYNLAYDLNNNNKDQVFCNIAGNWSPITKGTPMIRPIMGDDFLDISVEEYLSENNLKVYPNPTKDLIQLTITDNNPYQLQIFNSTGQLILEKTVLKTETLSLKEYGCGLYIVKILSKNKAFSKKIIVL